MHDDDFDSALDGATSALANVSFELEIDGVQARWGVRSVALREAVSEAYSGIIEALIHGDAPQVPALLGKKLKASAR